MNSKLIYSYQLITYQLITHRHQTKAHHFSLNHNSFFYITTSKFGIRSEPPHMYISHKWSYIETICPTQSQSHILTYSLSGSYMFGSACPSHISSFSHLTTTGTIRPAQPHYHIYSS